MTLGEKIAALLSEAHMTKVDLAKKLGLANAGVISHWVKDRHKPEWENIEKLAKIFKKDPSYFKNDVRQSHDDLLHDHLRDKLPATGEGLSVLEDNIVYRLETMRFVDLPIVGVLPAGKPTEAIEDYQGKYSVPREVLGADPKNCRVARARGDSMIDLGICDGDMLAFRVQQTADDGDVVVAEVEGLGVTCKRFRKKKGEFYLEPANSNHQEIRRPFKVLGKVIWRGGRPWR